MLVVAHGLLLTYDHDPTEDELVSLDELQEKVQEFEDYVQSTDIAAMQSTSPSVSPMCEELITGHRIVIASCCIKCVERDCMRSLRILLYT